MEEHIKKTNMSSERLKVESTGHAKCRHLSKPRGVHRFVHQGSGSDDSTMCGKKICDVGNTFDRLLEERTCLYLKNIFFIHSVVVFRLWMLAFWSELLTALFPK